MPVQDYTEFTAVVDELLAEFGRSVTFYKKDRTPIDANKPYLAPAWDDASPPAGHTVVTTVVSVGGAQSSVDMNMLDLNGLVTARKDGYIVSGPAKLGVDLMDFNQMLDGGVLRSIERIAEAAPGDTVIFYWVEVTD